MAKQGKVQRFFEYLAARTILASLRLLPLPVAMKVGSGIGVIAYNVAGDLRKTGRRNVSLAFPEISEQEQTQLLKACFESLGRTLGVFSHFDRLKPSELMTLVETEGLQNLDDARAQGRGVILFTGHLGAWELSSFALSALDRPLTFLVRRMDNPDIEKLVDHSRTRLGNRTLDKLAAARPMLRVLQTGETLGLLLDLNTLDEEAIFVDFFGVPASTNFMVAKLALRNQTPIIPVFAPWNNEIKKFRLEVAPPVIFESGGDESEDVRRLTEKLSLIIEDKIREYPEQWLWIHKRWKTRPPGEPDIYS